MPLPADCLFQMSVLSRSRSQFGLLSATSPALLPARPHSYLSTAMRHLPVSRVAYQIVLVGKRDERPVNLCSQRRGGSITFEGYLEHMSSTELHRLTALYTVLVGPTDVFTGPAC